MILAKIFLLIGKALLITPSYKNKCSFLYKFYGILTLILVTIISLIQIERELQIFLPMFVHIKIVIVILMHINLVAFNYSTVLSLVLLKRREWGLLMPKLKNFLSIIEDSSRIHRMSLLSLAILVLSLGTNIAVYCFWSWTSGFKKYFLAHSILYLQYYAVLAQNIYIFFILSLLLGQYKKLVGEMEEMKQCDQKVLGKLEYCFCSLKDAVDDYNAIFSWPLTLNICFTVLFTVNNLDFVFATPRSYKDLLFWRITLDLLMVAMFFVLSFSKYTD